jgi:hypothetical protein
MSLYDHRPHRGRPAANQGVRGASTSELSAGRVVSGGRIGVGVQRRRRSRVRHSRRVRSVRRASIRSGRTDIRGPAAEPVWCCRGGYPRIYGEASDRPKRPTNFVRAGQSEQCVPSHRTRAPNRERVPRYTVSEHVVTAPRTGDKSRCCLGRLRINIEKSIRMCRSRQHVWFSHDR